MNHSQDNTGGLGRTERTNLQADHGLGIPIRMEIEDRYDGDLRFVQGRLNELSLDGLDLALPLAAPVNEGDTIEFCAIEMPDHSTFHCSVKVSHVDADDAYGRLHINAVFVALATWQKTVLQRCLAT
ncbi:MAG: PilZ domain-containing protein, partial [Chromatiales bacterium]|nr:PilZ domain-containing protein [Chromatiales bacterium]